MKFSINKSKYILFASLLGAIITVVGGSQLMLQVYGMNNLLAQMTGSVQHKAPFFVHLQSVNGDSYNQKDTPSSLPMKLASSYVFESYEERGTNPIPIKSNWSVELDGNDSSDPKGIFMENCQNSSTCTFHSGTYPQKMILKAQNKKGGAQMKMNVSSDLPPNPFKDDVPDWARATVYFLYRQGVMKGYTNGNFGSADPVSRGQAVLMMYNLMIFHGFDPQSFMQTKSCDGLYSDLKEVHYAAQAICLGHHLGWFKDFVASKEFKPDESIKRHEIAQMVANIITNEGFGKFLKAELNESFKMAKMNDEDIENFLQTVLDDVDFNIKLSAQGVENFDDVTFDTPNASAIGFVYYLKIMRGSSDKLFNSYNSLNRAEIAQIIVNMSAYFKNYN